MKNICRVLIGCLAMKRSKVRRTSPINPGESLDYLFRKSDCSAIFLLEVQRNMGYNTGLPWAKAFVTTDSTQTRAQIDERQKQCECKADEVLGAIVHKEQAAHMFSLHWGEWGSCHNL